MTAHDFFDPWITSKNRIDVFINGFVAATNISESLEKPILEAYARLQPKEKIHVQTAQSRRYGEPGAPMYTGAMPMRYSVMIPTCSNGSTWIHIDTMKDVYRPMLGDGRDIQKIAATVWNLANITERGEKFRVLIREDRTSEMSEPSGYDKACKSILRRLATRVRPKREFSIFVFDCNQASARERISYISYIESLANTLDSEI